MFGGLWPNGRLDLTNLSHLMRITYHNNQLFCEQVSVQSIVQQCGTPTYLYSLAELKQNWQSWQTALENRDHQICFAVKACSNIHLLQKLSAWGCGFDVVSIGECQRVIAAQGDLSNTVFSGVGKQPQELSFALLHGIQQFNVESITELNRIQTMAAHLQLKPRVALRFNPQTHVETHPYLTTGGQADKFGLTLAQIQKIFSNIKDYPSIHFCGFSVHVGSQLKSTTPLIQALQTLTQAIWDQCPFSISTLNIGGGLGVAYTNEAYPSPSEFLAPVWQHLPVGDYQLIVEPGRSMVANTGLLASQVIDIKENVQNRFVILDAAMNDLTRPSLYQAEHQLLEVTPKEPQIPSCIVGPICESGDIFNRSVPVGVEIDDLVCIKDVGAYGFSMSSNYNSRGRACEVLIDGGSAKIIRARETIDDQLSLERDCEKVSLCTQT